MKHFQLIVSRGLSWWKMEKSYPRKFLRHLGLLQRSPWNMTGWKNWAQEVAGGGDDSQQTQPKTKNPLVRTGRPVKSEQPPDSSAQEIDKRVLFDCESTNLRSGRDVSSCVPVSVERLDQDKDADENVDADHDRTARTNNPSVCSHNTRKETLTSESLGCHTQLFRKPKNFRVRELVKKIESHPHRQAFQADAQQNSAYNPFSDESKAMIREMFNVELFGSCETIPKGAMLRMLFLESRNSLLHLWTSLGWKRIQPKFSPMATGCFLNPALRHQKRETLWCSARQNWGTERAFLGPQRAGEMCQKECWWNSRSLPTRFRKSWFATQNWQDRGDVHRDG